jgi:hypothetical protein
MTARQEVLKLVPQARYMNLSNPEDGVCHCIDDDYNDRYLAQNESSRENAWKAALLYLKEKQQ